MIQLKELTVRRDPVGGLVLDTVRWRRASPYDSDRLVILVHGFNVRQEAATDSYVAFLRQLSVELGPVGSAKLPPVWAFHWPGDHPSRFFSKVTYSVRVPIAQMAGRLLGELLMRLHSKQRVFLIGHSLGCRVLLEALVYMANERVSRPDAGAEVSLTCLLAAAVPIECCTGDKEPYRHEVLTNTIHVLYSRNDYVLRFFFPGGQRQLGENKGEAVGLHGLPLRRWIRAPDTGLFHKSYWKKPKSVSIVARMIEPTLPRLQSIRSLPVQEPAEPWTLDSRKLHKRSFGDDLDSGWNDCWSTADSIRAA